MIKLIVISKEENSNYEEELKAYNNANIGRMNYLDGNKNLPGKYIETTKLETEITEEEFNIMRKELIKLI